MVLYFLRHGIAVDRGHPKYKDDSLRPLTTLGRKKMLGATQGMKTLGLKFDAILSSPYVRARQTAEIAAHAYKIKNILITNNLLPPACIKEILKETQTGFPKAKNILLVGHEPHFTELISELLESGKPLNIDLKKGGLCSVSIEGPFSCPHATFNWLMTSTQLNLLDPGL